jgi:hypothetical protein
LGIWADGFWSAICCDNLLQVVPPEIEIPVLVRNRQNFIWWP